ncbi:hypothetical protein [Micromonospora sp. WMMD1082]|uniref:hypothetical protein n=1 Tax=Micromonospora sp. WMMD1082 TaxID=3016104 RepID=UPI002416C22C|nr:hypothetical protein [Micromonospora sp. WMMD1082]MDG4795222.1 hypothetical protein [Micromonospora sp. WMMD1082]
MRQETAQARFAAFVRAAVDAAAADQGKAIRDVVRGHIGGSTVFRWLGGGWQKTPELAKVRAFCEATGADYNDALMALAGRIPIPTTAAVAPDGGPVRPLVPATRCEPTRRCPHCAAGRPPPPDGYTVHDIVKIASLEEPARRALPPAFHRPHWDELRWQWRCLVCPREPWPCLVAQAHGDLVGV